MSLFRRSGKIFQSYYLYTRILNLVRYRHVVGLPFKYKHELNLGGRRTFNEVEKYSTNVADDPLPPEVSEGDVVSSLQPIDEALAELDKTAKRTGRVFKRNVNEVVEMVEELNSLSSIQSLYLIRCCGSLLRDEMPEKRTKLVDKIWSQIKKMDVPIDASHYNSMLKVYLENGKDFSPVEFLGRMEKDNIQPNRVTYQRLIEKFCTDGDLTGATTVLEHMKEMKMTVGEPVFNSLIKCYGKQNNFEGVNNILQVMTQAGLNPSAETFAIVACCYAEKGDIQQVQATIDKAISEGMYIPDKSYFDIIYSLAISENGDHIDSILSQIENFAQIRLHCGETIINLVNAGKEDYALKILLYVLEKINFGGGIVQFVKHLVIADVPTDKVIAYCQALKKYHDYITCYATKAVIENMKIDDIPKYFEQMSAEGLPIRRHYFWPILASYKNDNNQEGVWKTLKMMHDMALPADHDTYIEYVFPAVNDSDPEAVLECIRNSGQPDSPAVEPLFYHYCKKGDLKNAAHVSKTYSINLMNNMFLQFIPSFTASAEHEDYLLQILYNTFGDTSFGISEGLCSYGTIFLDMAKARKLNFCLLEKAHNMGITLSRSSCDLICKQIGRNDPESIQLVRNMQFGSTVTNYEQQLSSVHPRDMSLDEAETALEKIKESGGSPRAVLSHLLVLYCKNKDIKKVIETKNELDSYGFVFTPSSYALMISTCISCANYDEAIKLKQRLVDEYPDFKLDAVKNIDYVNLLMQFGKFEEAIKVMEEDCSELSYPGKKERVFDSVRRLLGTASSTGDAEMTNRIYNFFMDKLNTSVPFIEFADSLVNVHLVRNDVNEAIAVFKKFAMNYNLYPCRNKLFRKFITENNHEKLQLLVDISTMHGGRYSVLPDLALCFIESGHFQQACKTLQSVNERVDKSQIEQLCRRLFRQNKVSELEQFVQASKFMVNIDRDQLYFYILQLYSQTNDYGKALEVWNLMQEENVQPSVKSLCLIADLLKKNNQPVPFVVPELGTYAIDDEEKEMSNHYMLNSDDGKIEVLQQHISSGNVEAVLKTLDEMKKGHIRSLTTADMTKIIDLLVVNNQLRNLISNVQAMSFVIDKVRQIVRPLLEKYSSNGDVELVKLFLDFLPDFTLKNVNYSYFYFKAYIVSGKQEVLLSELEKNLKMNLKIFSFAGFQELLTTAPSLEDRASKLVELYAEEVNFDLPKKAMWLYYFISGNFSKAEEIFKQNSHIFRHIDSIAVSVLKTVRSNQDIALGEKFLEFTKNQNVREVIRDRVYSCLLDVMVEKSKFQEAAKLVKEVENQGISLNIFSEISLMTLKKEIEETGEQVNFKVSAQAEESSSDSSDSDEVKEELGKKSLE